MNRIIQKILLLLAMLVSAFGMNAAPVDISTAREVAEKFVNANASVPLRDTDDLQLVATYSISRGDAAFYIFNTPNGFIIVSADDCATPILGYSDEGKFDIENIPIQLQDYLHGFVEQIEYGIENHLVADEATSQQWEMVQSMGHLVDQKATTVVPPLLTDKWYQGCYYNSLCPVDSTSTYCDHVLVGCTATSFAQILRYWGYPISGMGSHTYTPPGYPEQTANFGATTYDWLHMPDSLTDSSTSTEINAVATLMWHCSVAVDMKYGPEASSGSIYNVVTALKDYFGYSDELYMAYKSSYNDAEWLTLMKDCLNLGRPIHYSGYGTDSHAFVCDGFNADNLLHFNWGWAGKSNGYFAIGALTPEGHNYSNNNYAIINIHPGCTSGTSFQITATADTPNGGTINGIGTYNCGEVCTLTAISLGDYSFMYWTENGELVSYEASYSFMAMDDRNLVAHFALPLNVTTSVNPAEGGTASGGGVCHFNQLISLTATPNEGYVFNHWTKDGEEVSYFSTMNLNVTETAEYVANFRQMDGIVIGEATSTSAYIPTFHRSSLTQQIYTNEEMGNEACDISSVAFFNTGSSTTRNFAIYMVNTDKTTFESSMDWISVEDTDLVFSGTFTMEAKDWTTIYFNTPFNYDGSSNVALIIDDNTNSSYGGTRCRTFDAEGNQALRVYGSGIDYDPYNPTGYMGTLMSMKNQVVFGVASYNYTVTATVNLEEGGTTSGGGLYYFNQSVTLTATANEGYTFVNWTENGEEVSTESNYSFVVTGNRNLVANFALSNSTFTKSIIGYDSNVDGYNLIASPIGDVAPTDVTNMLTNTYDLYRFNQTADLEWQNYKKHHFNLETGKGYLYANSQNVNLIFTGLAFTTQDGKYTVDLVYTDTSEGYVVDMPGWNLLGNPFAVNAYLVGDPDYYTMNDGGSEFIIPDAQTTRLIKAMEGVFFVATSANQSVTFTTTAPSMNGSRLGINLSNDNNVIDRAIVRFDESSELPKFQLNSSHTKVYFTQESQEYAVVRGEEMGEMPVSFKAENNGSYTLSVNSNNVEFHYLHLIDNLTSIDIDLLQTPSYSFEAKTTDYASRFKLVFATGKNSETFAFFSNGSFVINNDGEATLQVIDITGRIMKSESINGCANVNVNVVPGIYMLRLVNGDNVKVQKAVVK